MCDKCNQWRDIETAPKDGTRILLFDPAIGPTVISGWWDKSFEIKYDEEKDETFEVGAWTDGCVVSFGYEETASYSPTHWQPLPEAPQE